MYKYFTEWVDTPAKTMIFYWEYLQTTRSVRSVILSILRLAKKHLYYVLKYGQSWKNKHQFLNRYTPLSEGIFSGKHNEKPEKKMRLLKCNIKPF